MTPPLTDEALAELRALYDKATPGDWVARFREWPASGWAITSDDAQIAFVYDDTERFDPSAPDPASASDASAVVALRNSFPALIAALDEARAERDRAVADEREAILQWLLDHKRCPFGKSPLWYAEHIASRDHLATP